MRASDGPWIRAAALFAIVAVGFSQVPFNLILRNPDHFPRELRFHVWTVVWTLLLPWLVLLAADLAVRRAAGEESRGYRLWRSALNAMLAVLFLRQIRVHHLAFPMPAWAEAAAYLAAGAGVGFLGLRRDRAVDRYVAVLGLLGALLTAQYVRGAWSRSADGPAYSEPASTSSGTPVVLLVFDELSLDVLVKDGKVDRERFPRLAALADEGAWFPRATSNAVYTEPSVSTLLTGRLHPPDGAPLLTDRIRKTHLAAGVMAWPHLRRWLAGLSQPGDRWISRTDAEALKMGPWETAEFIGAALSESAFFGRPLGAPSENEFKTPDLWDIWTSRDVLGVEAESFLRLLRKDYVRGRFLYWHCSLPHSPFGYDAEGRRHGKENDRFVRGADARAVWENYLEHARGVDRLTGLVVDRLKSEGVYDESILIVTSDHGLRGNGAMEPEGYPDTRSGLEVRVPFLLRGPSVKPGVHPAEYQHVDFVPTVLELLGHPAPEDVDGISAFAAHRPSRTPRFFHGDAEFALDRASGLWRRKK